MKRLNRSLRPGERLVFRDRKGKFTKYSKRKKLTAIVVDEKSKFLGTLNKVIKGKPIPTTFKRTTVERKRSHTIKRVPSEQTDFKITFSSNTLFKYQIYRKDPYHQAVKKIRQIVLEGNTAGVQINFLNSGLSTNNTAVQVFEGKLTKAEIQSLLNQTIFESYRNSSYRMSPKKYAREPEKPFIKKSSCVVKILKI